ncbi:hypothetical protein BVX93_01710, partial [bacterium B13(2017)]
MEAGHVVFYSRTITNKTVNEQEQVIREILLEIDLLYEGPVDAPRTSTDDISDYQQVFKQVSTMDYVDFDARGNKHLTNKVIHEITDTSNILLSDGTINFNQNNSNAVHGIKIEIKSINFRGFALQEIETRSFYRNGAPGFYQQVIKDYEYDRNGTRLLKTTKRNIYLSDENFEGSQGLIFFPDVGNYFYRLTSIEIEENLSFDPSGKYPTNVRKETYHYLNEDDDEAILASQGLLLEIDGIIMKKVSGILIFNEGFNSRGMPERVTEYVYTFDEDGSTVYTDGTQTINTFEEGRIIESDQLVFEMTLLDGVDPLTGGGDIANYDISIRKMIKQYFEYNDMGYKTDIVRLIYKLLDEQDGFSDDPVLNEEAIQNTQMFNINGKTIALNIGEEPFEDRESNYLFIENNGFVTDSDPEFEFVSGSIETFSHFNSRGEADRAIFYNFLIEEGQVLYTDCEVKNKLEYDLSGKVTHSLTAQIKFFQEDIQEGQLVPGYGYTVKQVLEIRTEYYPDGNVYKITQDRWGNLDDNAVLVTQTLIPGSKYNTPKVDTSSGELILGKVIINDVLNFRGLVLEGREFNYAWIMLGGELVKSYYNTLSIEKTYEIDGKTLIETKEATSLLTSIQTGDTLPDTSEIEFHALKITHYNEYDTAHDNPTEIEVEYYHALEDGEYYDEISDENKITFNGVQFKKDWGEIILSEDFNEKGIATNRFTETYVINDGMSILTAEDINWTALFELIQSGDESSLSYKILEAKCTELGFSMETIVSMIESEDFDVIRDLKNQLVDVINSMRTEDSILGNLEGLSVNYTENGIEITFGSISITIGVESESYSLVQSLLSESFGILDINNLNLNSYDMKWLNIALLEGILFYEEDEIITKDLSENGNSEVAEYSFVYNEFEAGKIIKSTTIKFDSSMNATTLIITEHTE